MVKSPERLAAKIAYCFALPDDREDMKHEILLAYYAGSKQDFRQIAIDTIRKWTHRGKIYQPLPDLLPLEDFTEQVIATLDIQRALAQLSPKEYALIIALYYAGESMQDIATQYHYSPQGIHVALHKIRRKLKRILTNASTNPSPQAA